jgi:pyruvate,water dikinase
MGFPTPATAVVRSSFLTRLLGPAGAGDVCVLSSEATLGRLQREIAAVRLPHELRSALAMWLRVHPATILRSSAACEDGRSFSLAGQLRSYLIRSGAAAEAALRRCWASLFTPTVADYLQRVGGGAAFEPTLDVLVQEWVEPRVSGVSFTGDTPGQVLTEVVYGHGELLVSGIVSPDRYLYEHGRERDRAIGLKLLAAASHDTTDLFPADLASVSFCDGDGGSACVVDVDHEAGVAYVELPLTAARSACLTTQEVERISRLVLLVEGVLGFPVDVEWVIGRDDSLTLVQARPSTRPLDSRPGVRAGTGSAGLLIASAGVASGVAFVARSAQDCRRMPSGSILVATETTPEYTPALLRAAAVIVERGGMLSHTAIVCRELGIPCVTDVADATSRFRAGAFVTVDAVAGEIRAEEPE